MVCEGFRQVRRRSRRFWKTNTTPTLANIQRMISHSRAGDLPGIEATEVVGHQREGEARPVNVLGGSHIWAHIKLINLFLRYDLLEKPAVTAFSTPSIVMVFHQSHCSLGEETVLERLSIFFAAWTMFMQLVFKLGACAP